MELLSNEDHKFLRCIYKNPVRADLLAKKLRLTDGELDVMINSLFELKYIYVHSSSDKSGYRPIEILQEGKAAVEARKREARRWRIPLIVSICATLIAALSLALTLIMQLC